MADPRDIKAKATELVMRPVRMVVIYKPTNESAMKDIPLKDCRAFFEACVASMRKKLAENPSVFYDTSDEQFIAVQIDWEDKTVITSGL